MFRNGLSGGDKRRRVLIHHGARVADIIDQKLNIAVDVFRFGRLHELKLDEGCWLGPRGGTACTACRGHQRSHLTISSRGRRPVGSVGLERSPAVG